MGVREDILAYLQFKSVYYNNKKGNKIFLMYKEIQMGSGAKSYMTNGLLICG
jgi:hypothetical protein